MKDPNKKIGGVEGVENVVERLQAEMGKVDKVGKVLEEPLSEGVVVDEEEIDDELGAMVIEEKKARGEVEVEKTRKRLEELERAKENEKEKPAESRTGEQLENTKRPSQMIIEDENRGSPERKKWMG